MIALKKLLTLSSTLLVISSCSSPSLYPPQSDSQSESLYSQIAPKAKLGDCQTLRTVFADSPQFPARELLVLKLLKNCQLENAELLSLWVNEFEQLPKYIRPAIYKESYRLASENQEFSAWAADFAKEMAGLADRQDERIEWLSRAQEFATKSERTDLLEEISKIRDEVAPHFITDPSDQDLYRVARDVERQRDFNKARSFYLRIMSNKKWDHTERLRAYDRYAMSFKLERDKERYTQETAKTVAWLQSIPNRSDFQDRDLEQRWIDWARAEWTQDRLEKGHLELTKLTRSLFVSNNAKAKAYWLLGMMERERKNYKLAYAFFELGSRVEVSDADTKEKIEWAIAWNRFQAQEYDLAITAFRRYLESDNDDTSDTTLRFAYWLGSSLIKTKQKSEGEEIFKEIIQKSPRSYYSLLAHQQLGIPQSPLPYTFPQEEKLDLKAAWIFYFEEWEALKEYLKSFKVAQQIIKVTPFFERARAYREGILSGYKLLSDYEFSDVSALLYPKAYGDLFLSSGRFFNVSPFLLMAISRQESSFDTNARSYADAFGLLQVIPEKARAYHQAAGVAYTKVEDLYRPEINIPIATYMIKKLLINNEGHLIQTIASYNAGSAPVAKWMESRFNGSWEQFVENIPYEETRNYVKLVLRNAFIYRGLSLSESAHIPKELMVDNN